MPQELRSVPVRAWGWVLPCCFCLVACGSGASSGNSAGVLTQMPECPGGVSALKIEGTIDGGAIDDMRSTNINAGTQNIGMGMFSTPLGGLASLDSNQLALTIDWSELIAYGQTAPITGGSLVLPATHPDAGAAFCVSGGSVGYVKGGSEDGVFKFDVTEVKAGADCSGVASTADLRGCYE